MQNLRKAHNMWCAFPLLPASRCSATHSYKQKNVIFPPKNFGEGEEGYWMGVIMKGGGGVKRATSTSLALGQGEV